MEKYKLNSINEDLRKFDYLAKEHDYIEVTEWHNGEGWNIDLNGTTIQLADGQLKAINYLTQTLDLYDRN
jgi:hypothetical protein